MLFSKLTLATIAAYAVQSSSADSIYSIASTTDDFSTLAAAVDAAGLTDTLSGEGSFTVFAPPNAAFEALGDATLTKLLDPVWQPQLQDIILYHALGSKVISTDLKDGMTAQTLNFQKDDITINLQPPRVNENSKVILTLVDVPADNGVVHGIDTVLLPPSATSSIVDIAVGGDAFSTLVAALSAAGLVDTLKGDGPFTVFAPTNDAFAALPEGTVDDLLKPENIDKLTAILKLHVVSGNANSASLATGPVTTLEGSSVDVVVTTEGVMVKDAKVVTADIIASNGIIHVVDSVLLPNEDDTAESGATEDDTAESGAFVYGTTVAAAAVAAVVITIA